MALIDATKKKTTTKTPKTTSATPAPTATASKSTSSSILDRAASGEFSNINTGVVKTNIANRTAGATTATTTTPDSTYYPRYTQNEQVASDYLDTFQAPKSADQIQGEMLKSAQSEVNSLNDYYGQLLKEQQTVNQGNEQATASVNTLTGLAGSTEANVTAGKAAATSQQANDKILAQKQLELNTLLTNIRTSAATEATTQKTNARLSAQDVMTNRATKMAEATTNVTQLAKSGVTVEGLKTSDPTSYAHLAQQVGGEAQLKAMMILNRPQETIEDKKVVNGSYMIAYRNPLTGAMRMEVLDLGLPSQYTKSVDIGDQMMFMPDNFNPNDPNSPQPIYVPKGMSPDQQESNAIGWYNAKTGRINANKNTGTAGSGATYTNDLDAVVGAAVSVIPTKFGQATFQNQIASARNDADKINLVAAQVLKGQPAEVRRDFANQAVGLNEIDKALAMLDSNTQTGVLQAGAQYTFNVFGKDYDPKLAQLNSHITAAIQPYRNSVTGAAWGTQEDGEYQQLFGSTKYSPTELKTRLMTLKEILKSKSASTLNAFVNPMGTNENYFDSGTYAPSEGEQVNSQTGEPVVHGSGDNSDPLGIL